MAAVIRGLTAALAGPDPTPPEASRPRAVSPSFPINIHHHVGASRTPTYHPACTACRDTGYLPDGRPCTCDARPFGVDEPAPRPVPAAADWSHLSGVDELTAIELAVDRAMAWSSRYLGAVIGLGYWAPMLDSPWASDIVTRRVAAAIVDLLVGADELDFIAAELRRAAHLDRAP